MSSGILLHITGIGDGLTIDEVVGLTLVEFVEVSLDRFTTSLASCLVRRDDSSIKEPLFGPSFVIDYEFEGLRCLIAPCFL